MLSDPACRRLLAPQVIAYWLKSSLNRTTGGIFNSWGAGKSGIPSPGSTASYLRASIETLRIFALSVNLEASGDQRDSHFRPTIHDEGRPGPGRGERKDQLKISRKSAGAVWTIASRPRLDGSINCLCAALWQVLQEGRSCQTQLGRRQVFFLGGIADRLGIGGERFASFLRRPGHPWAGRSWAGLRRTCCRSWFPSGQWPNRRLAFQSRLEYGICGFFPLCRVSMIFSMVAGTSLARADDAGNHNQAHHARCADRLLIKFSSLALWKVQSADRDSSVPSEHRLDERNLFGGIGRRTARHNP